MGRKRFMLARVGWLLATYLAVAPAIASAHDDFSYLSTPDGFVVLALPDAATDGPFPVVLILPDALGPDRRSKAYADTLNAQGVATVELLPAVEDGNEAPPDPATVRPSGILAALSSDPRVDASRLGVLAFGAGGLTALRDPALGAAPAALLYPGCAHLPAPPADRPLLVLHGGMDRADPPGACARWTVAGGRLVRRHEYVHATYGWDYSDGPWSDGLALLPSPGQPARRVWARSDPATTANAAARVADFLVAELDSGGAGAR